MIRGVLWVRFGDNNSEASQQNQNSSSACAGELHSDREELKQLEEKQETPRGHRPSSRGISCGDEFENQLESEEEFNLIPNEMSEEKSSEFTSDFSCLISKDVESPEELFSSEKQVFSEKQEQLLSGNHRTPEKSMEMLPTPFDTAPGFLYPRKSSKNSKTIKQERLGESSPRKKLYNSDSGNAHASSQLENQELGWTSFEREREDLSPLITSNDRLKANSEDGNNFTLLATNISDSVSHSNTGFGDKHSLQNTSISTKCWVSFDEDNRHKVDSTNTRREFQSQLSENLTFPDSTTSSAALLETVIPDLFEIATEMPSAGSSSSNEKIVDHGTDKDSSNDNMTQTFANMEKHANNNDLDTDSNFSGEICDLNALENDSLLRDTRKPFPKEGIFQASSCKKTPEKCSPRTPGAAKKALFLEPTIESDSSRLDDYPQPLSRTEWTFLYRYPDRKKHFVSREWVTVKVAVEGDAIHVSGRLENTDILKEIPLHPFFVFTLPVLHSNNGHGKVHSVKLQYVKYRETRKMSSKFQIEHIPSYTPVLKLASKDHKTLKEFVETVENVVRKIKSHRDKGITHRHEEIFIDCDDICQYELDGNGKVKQYNISCLIRLRAFITGIPDLYLFLNDINSYNKQKSKRTNGRQPKSNRWIKLENVEYHPSVDVAATNTEGGIVFKPPDSCSFELMRFRVRSRRELPTLFKASIDFVTSKSFEIKAECKIGGEGKTMKYRRTNIVIRFPIPTTWTSVFVKSRSFSGQKKYVQAKADQKTFASGTGRTGRCFIEVSTGSAKYEPEYSSLVWRVGDLPILASGVPADAVQTFVCHVNLPFDIDLPRNHSLCAEVEYEIPHAVGSEIQVQEVLLSDGRMPDKWVCYRALYTYTVFMTVFNKQRLASLS